MEILSKKIFKKSLIVLWFIFSACLTVLVYFSFSDYFFSRPEILKAAIPIPVISVLCCVLLKRISGRRIQPALLISMLIALAVCLRMERNAPIIIRAPEKTIIHISTDNDSEVNLIWAYWSRPDEKVNDEINEWHHISDIRSSQIQLQGSWLEQDRINNTCSGECSITLDSGINFSRPVLCFEGGTGTASVRINNNQYTIGAEGLLKIFAADSGLSRQTVFLLSFLYLCGIICFPITGLSVFLPIFTKQDRASFSVSGFIIYTAAFLIPILILCFICYLLKMWPFGEKTFLVTDMRVQYADYLLYFRNVLNGSKSLFYSFSKSIGDDFLSLYAYYLGNPLNWITALFPIEHFPAAVGIIVVLRYGLCGLAAAVYFRKVFRTEAETLIFSTAYALISLQFVIGEHIQLRDGAILLPLILLGIERLIFQRRSALYIAFLSAAFLVSYYSAYQICFFCVLYFLFRTLMAKRFSRKLIGRFLGASVISGALCAAFLVPVAIQLTKGMKTFDPSLFTFTRNMRFSELAGKLFNSAYDQGQTLTSGFPNIFCGLLITAGVPLFFLNREISRKEKLLSAAMLAVFTAAMQIKVLNLILHGFNEPVWWPYRYSFIICLFMITLVLRCYQQRNGITLLSVCISAALITGLLVYTDRQRFSWFTRDAFCLNLILVICVFLLWAIAATPKSKVWPLILILSGMDLLMNGWMILEDKTAYQRSETVSEFRQFFSGSMPVIDALNEYDDGFFRTEKTYSRDANDAMTLGYQGVGHYSSTLNYDLMRFLPKMGYRYYPWRFLYGEGADLAADSLLGIRYLISDEGSLAKPYDPVLTENGKTVFRNPFSLPAAFFAQDIQAADPDAAVFELQNSIFSALTGDGAPIYTETAAGPVTLNNMRQCGDREICYERILENEPASVSWKFTPGSGKDHYLYLKNDSDTLYPVSLYVNGEYLSEYFDGRGIPILPILSGDAGSEAEITIVPKDSAIRFDELLIRAEDTGVLARYADRISKSSLFVQKTSETSMFGTVHADSDGFLLFTIPFDKSWKVRIDGKSVPAEQAFDIFLAARVSEGDHNFMIRYTPEGLGPGAAVSAVSILILALIRIRNKNRQPCEEDENE